LKLCEILMSSNENTIGIDPLELSAIIIWLALVMLANSTIWSRIAYINAK